MIIYTDNKYQLSISIQHNLTGENMFFSELYSQNDVLLKEHI